MAGKLCLGKLLVQRGLADFSQCRTISRHRSPSTITGATPTKPHANVVDETEVDETEVEDIEDEAETTAAGVERLTDDLRVRLTS